MSAETAEQLAAYIYSLVQTDDEKGVLLIAKCILEADQAKDLLRKKGYGCLGLGLLKTVQLVAEQSDVRNGEQG